MDKKSNSSVNSGMRAAQMLSRLEKMYGDKEVAAPAKSPFNLQVKMNEHFVNRRPGV
jgi:hypothetical protein